MFDNVATTKTKLNPPPPVGPVANKPMVNGVQAKPAEVPARKTESDRKKEKFIDGFSRIFLLVVIVLLVVFLAGLMINYYFSINLLNKKINDVRAEYSQKVVLVNKYEGLSARLDAIEQASINFSEMLPQKKDLSKVLVKLEQMATKYDLVFNSINNTSTDLMVKEDHGQQIKKQRYEIVLSSGDYFTLKNYLSDIENNMRIIDVRSLVYSPDINMFFLNFEIYHLE